MSENFSYALNAIAPLILLIALGYVLKQRHMFDETFFKKANTLVFRVCLPVLLFYNIYNIEGLKSLRMDVVGYCMVIIVLLFGLGLVTAKRLIPDPKQKGVILQCVFRSNYAIIGIPIAEALGGAEAVATASLLSAFSIPLYNILAVFSLSIFIGGEKNKGIRPILKGIARNPLIRGVLCGILALIIRTLLPANASGEPVFSIRRDLPFVYTAVQNLARIASPLALIVLGGEFTFEAVKGMRKQIVIGTVWRIVLAPLLGVGAALILSTWLHLLNFGIMEFPSLIALFGTPVAVSSAIMAEEMKNDGTLAGQLVVWTSVLSIFTMFLTIVAIRSLVGA